MYYIGFANQYYTLWDVNTEDLYSTSHGCSFIFISGITTTYTYVQNLSYSLKKAESRANKICGFVPPVDESLRGQTRSFDRFKKIEAPDFLFAYGRFEGYRIATCTDTWQLFRVYNSDRNARRRVYARRRLIELGELKKYTWYSEGSRHNYATDEQISQESYKKAASLVKRGHHFTDGEKVELYIKCYERFGFDGAYGYCTIQKFTDEENREYIYMGSSPKEIYKGDVVSISATIKHDSYHEEDQTKLLRIKIVSMQEA